MMLSKKCPMYVCLVCSGLLCGCSSDFSGDRYSASNVGEVARTDRGVIVSMRMVEVREDGTGGAVLGAIGGGVVGSMFGRGKGRLLSTAAGAAAGGLAGNAIQNRAQEGCEYTVQLEDGRTITLTQGPKPPLSVGQRVYVINSERGRSRIAPAP